MLNKSYKYPSELYNLIDEIDNADDFNEILNIQTYKPAIYRKNSIYSNLYKNKNLDKFFNEIYTNDLFKFDIQKNFIITNDNHYLISTKYLLCKLFNKTNKIEYLIDTLDTNNYIILIYSLIKEKSNYLQTAIKKFKYKYLLFHNLLNINTLFDNSYHVYMNDKILKLIYKYHSELSLPEIKKLLKRIKYFDDKETYYKIFDLTKTKMTLLQFVELNTKFREIDIIDYVNLLSKHKIEIFDIFNGLKSIIAIKDHKIYFELLFEKKLLNNTNMNDFYIQLICIDKFMYKTYKYNSNSIIDIINSIFIKNNIDIKYIEKNYNYEIHSLYTDRSYKDYDIKIRFEKHIEKLKQIKRKTILCNLI